MSWNDKRTEKWVGILLRSGVLLAAALVMAGGLSLMVHRDHSAQSAYGQFHGQPEQFTSLRCIIDGARSFDPESLIMLGLAVLIATPVARVGMCLVGFSLERDGMYVGVSTIVLLILFYSLIFHH